MTDTWQTELADSYTRIDELLKILQLDPARVPVSLAAAGLFRMRVPKAYAARMIAGNPHDPLLRQVLPLEDELQYHPGYVADPVGDIHSVMEPGLLQKYQARVLMITTGACAVHCRYCFRRNFPYSEQTLSRTREQESLKPIMENATIREVIFSGGDPWVLTDRQLESRIQAIANIPHVSRLRIHTRMPVVLPNRISEGLLEILKATRLKIVVVIHANHPQELDATTARALRRLSESGCHLLNQTVLLKGINDCPDTLEQLSENLFEQGVLPYYLHLLDHATGTAHFEVDDEQATRLMNDLRCRLPGYLVPRLVREEQGVPYKTPIGAYE